MSEETSAATPETAKDTEKRKTGQDALALRYRAIFACIAAAALALVLLLSILPSGMAESSARRNVDAALAARFGSVFLGRDAPVAGERVSPKSAGAAFQFVFWAQGQDESAGSDYAGELIFIVPVQGMSGPLAAVFYYTQDGTLRFIGNCGGGIGGSSFDGAAPSATEISAGNLRKWSAKIEAVAAQIIAKEAGQ